MTKNISRQPIVRVSPRLPSLPALERLSKNGALDTPLTPGKRHRQDLRGLPHPQWPLFFSFRIVCGNDGTLPCNLSKSAANHLRRLMDTGLIQEPSATAGLTRSDANVADNARKIAVPAPYLERVIIPSQTEWLLYIPERPGATDRPRMHGAVTADRHSLGEQFFPGCHCLKEKGPENGPKASRIGMGVFVLSRTWMPP